MIDIRRSLCVRFVTSIALVVTLFISSSLVVLAAPGNSLSGEIIVSGNVVNGVQPTVQVNGENAMTGRTFFGSAVIATTENSSATVNLGKLGHVSLSPKSSVNITLSENGISGDLSAGQMRVFNNEGVAVSIRTHDNVITNDAIQAGDFSVDVSSGSTVTSYDAGTYYENGEPAGAAKKLTRRQAYWIVGGIAIGVLVGIIIWRVTDDDESPTR